MSKRVWGQPKRIRQTARMQTTGWYPIHTLARRSSGSTNEVDENVARRSSNSTDEVHENVSAVRLERQAMLAMLRRRLRGRSNSTRLCSNSTDEVEEAVSTVTVQAKDDRQEEPGSTVTSQAEDRQPSGGSEPLDGHEIAGSQIAIALPNTSKRRKPIKLREVAIAGSQIAIALPNASDRKKPVKLREEATAGSRIAIARDRRKPLKLRAVQAEDDRQEEPGSTVTSQAEDHRPSGGSEPSNGHEIAGSQIAIALHNTGDRTLLLKLRKVIAGSQIAIALPNANDMKLREAIAGPQIAIARERRKPIKLRKAIADSQIAIASERKKPLKLRKANFSDGALPLKLRKTEG